jgi:hypothetical protein
VGQGRKCSRGGIQVAGDSIPAGQADPPPEGAAAAHGRIAKGDATSRLDPHKAGRTTLHLMRRSALRHHTRRGERSAM